MKKVVLSLTFILLGVGNFSVKYYTTLLDSKDSAIIVNKNYPFKLDYQDKRTLTQAVDQILIGEAIREVGMNHTQKIRTRNF